MKKSVIKLQALTRGFLVRKKYKSQSISIFKQCDKEY